MPLNFTKMHGLGNDFLVFDAVRQRVRLSPSQVRFLADRHFGVGCDQVLLVEPAREADLDFYYRIFNGDGREVAQCGNGARCFARFVYDQGLSEKSVLDVGTAAGRIRLFLESDGDIRVDMGRPGLEPDEVPFVAPERASEYPLEICDQTLRIGAVSMGNPHAVIRVSSVDRAAVASIGPAVEAHERFPQHVNVGFMEVRSPEHIRLRVYERGAGETLACGSGACAAVVAGRIQGLLGRRVKVSLPGGDLVVNWDGEDAPVWLIGPAVSVFEGSIKL